MRNFLESYDVEIEVIEKYLVTVSARSLEEAIDKASAEYREGTVSSTKVDKMTVLEVYQEDTQ